MKDNPKVNSVHRHWVSTKVVKISCRNFILFCESLACTILHSPFFSMTRRLNFLMVPGRSPRFLKNIGYVFESKFLNERRIIKNKNHMINDRLQEFKFKHYVKISHLIILLFFFVWYRKKLYLKFRVRIFWNSRIAQTFLHKIQSEISGLKGVEKLSYNNPHYSQTHLYSTAAKSRLTHYSFCTIQCQRNFSSYLWNF